MTLLIALIFATFETHASRNDFRLNFSEPLDLAVESRVEIGSSVQKNMTSATDIFSIGAGFQQPNQVVINTNSQSSVYQNSRDTISLSAHYQRYFYSDSVWKWGAEGHVGYSYREELSLPSAVALHSLPVSLGPSLRRSVYQSLFVSLTIAPGMIFNIQRGSEQNHAQGSQFLANGKLEIGTLFNGDVFQHEIKTYYTRHIDTSNAANWSGHTFGLLYGTLL